MGISIISDVVQKVTEYLILIFGFAGLFILTL